MSYCDGLDRCILYCILFVFMLELLCFCIATEFSVNKDLYIISPILTHRVLWVAVLPSVLRQHGALQILYCIFVLYYRLTILIIHHHLTPILGLNVPFLQILPTVAFFFFLTSDSMHGFHGLFTDTSEQIPFYFLVSSHLWVFGTVR